MSDYGLADSWHLQHPSSREYSFFSPLHRSYSRLNFFLTSNSLISNITQSTIHPIIISDHAPVTIKWTRSCSHKTIPRWCFNTSLLQDPQFDSVIKKEWALFLEMNESPESSSSLLWETGKTVLRGIIISFSVHKIRKKKKKKFNWNKKLNTLKILTWPTQQMKLRIN